MQKSKCNPENREWNPDRVGMAVFMVFYVKHNVLSKTDSRLIPTGSGLQIGEFELLRETGRGRRKKK